MKSCCQKQFRRTVKSIPGDDSPHLKEDIAHAVSLEFGKLIKK
jgi:hypothetical protein